MINSTDQFLWVGKLPIAVFSGKSAENRFIVRGFFVISEKVLKMGCNFCHYDVK
jgi:hypothetical protein